MGNSLIQLLILERTGKEGLEEHSIVFPSCMKG